jgi:hypothetical protein
MQFSPRGTTVPPESVWDDFAAGIRDRPDVRVCISTEDFGRISRSAPMRKIVDDLGADRLHVVAVARVYHRLLPSHWQERIKSHERLTYDEWLHALFEGDASQRAHRSFWTSHDIERMASLWLEALPADRFTVVVSDDSDRLLLSRTFEQLLDLPEGLLAPTGSSNASLSMNAAELLRRLNQVFDERGWSDRDYRTLVRSGVVAGLQQAGRTPYDVPVPRLPEWVRPLVAERSRRRIEAIHTLGINVVGDPERLMPPDDAAPDPADFAPESISVEAATAALAGALDAVFRRRDATLRAARTAARREAGRSGPADPPMSTVDGRALVRELGQRLRSRLRPGR